MSSPSVEPGRGSPRGNDAALAKAARGSVWAIAGFFGSQVARLGGNLILTRIIAKEAFGVMLIVNVVLQGLTLFSDVGIGPSVIQNRRDDAKFLNTAWTIQAIRGVVLTLIAAAIAVPVAAYYDKPALIALIPFAGVGSLLAGLRSTKLFTLNRNLNIGRLTSIELASHLLGLGVTLIWAFLHPSVWALAAGGVMAMAAKTVMSQFALTGPPNRPTWDKDAAKALFSFGKWVFISTLLGFIASQADRLVFGKLVADDVLGVYAIALLIAATPQQVFRHLAATVNFPLYSRTLREERPLAPVFRASRRRILIFAGWILSGMIAGGPVAIALLYEDSYADAGWMVQLLAFGTWFNVLEATLEAALLARGESGKVALANLWKIVGMAILMPVGWHFAGFPGAIAGFSASESFRYLSAARSVRQADLRAGRQELGFSGMLLLASAAGWLAVAAVGDLHLPVVVQALLVFVVVSLVWLPLGLPFLRKIIARVRS